MPTITCPNSTCRREGLEVPDDTLVIPHHYPSPKKTFTPEHPCYLSGKAYSGASLPAETEVVAPASKTSKQFQYESGLHGSFNP